MLATVMAASAMAGCHGGGGNPQHVRTSYDVAADVRTLVVAGDIGDVRVTGGTAAAVSVTQDVVSRGAAPALRHRLTAGTLRLTGQCAPHDPCSISYQITVPRSIAVRVTDRVGTVSLGALAGQVAVSVGTGRIDLSALSGPVQAHARAGSVTGREMSSARADLRVSTGEIDVSFLAAPVAISATTDVAAITLRVPGNVAYDVTASATVGHIGVSVSQNTAAPRRITAHTGIGSIKIEPAP